MTEQISQAVHRMIDLQLERHAWLLRAGPIAKQLNEISKREAGSAEEAPARNHGH